MESAKEIGGLTAVSREVPDDRTREIAPSLRPEIWPSVGQLLCLSNEELRGIDPLVMNLVVAKGIPCFADLDIGHYVRLADQWASDIRHRLPRAEAHFHRSSANWKNDIRFFRLGIVCWYVDEVLGVTYPDELADAEGDLYADAMNVFLNGLMDRRRGSCASMPTLHVAIGWRLGWPVSLACAGTHLFCRYDDGEVIHNIEATTFGRGGFRSHPDDCYREQYRIPDIAVSCGSDLRAVTAREMLGLFIAIRAFHHATVHEMREAEVGLLLARHLFPTNRLLYGSQMEASIQCGLRLFDRGEEGHPANVGHKLREWLRAPDYGNFWTTITTETENANNDNAPGNQRIAAAW
jgi:hypothetical protein